ncbi:MAG: alcohol dehydrogenase catalytic domain-containing protein [Chloroflexi bacterium]|nr:alcohol dehydrogenase catalytic domain-containing protein [Chloroflexota bacterium]
MKGLWLENQRLSYRDDLPIPVVRHGEALIKIRYAGICATDLEMVRGYYPFTGIPGHEFVGDVVSCEDRPDLLGKRIVGEINITCGNCDRCKRGERTHCRNRKVLGINQWNGVFAEYCVLPQSNLYEVPHSISDETAIFTEPLAAALEIQQQVHIKPNDHVLLIGAGRLGQLIAYTLALTSCKLQVVTRHANQKAMLLKKSIPVIDELKIQMSAMDIVIEATGSPHGFDIARRAVRPGGIIVLKSTYKGDLTLNMSSIVVDEIKIVGSRCGPFDPAIRYLNTGIIDPASMIDSIYELENGVAAFEHAAAPGILKVLIKP